MANTLLGMADVLPRDRVLRHNDKALFITTVVHCIREMESPTRELSKEFEAFGLER